MSIIAKYKFDSSVYADLIPEFNSEFTSDLYTVTDELDGEVTTRSIESDSLPTLMRFGRAYVDGESNTDNRTDSLLEVLDMNTSELTNCYNMFRYCKNLTSITCDWDTSKVTDMRSMFAYCSNLTTLDVSNFDTSKVTTMYAMFANMSKLTSLRCSNLTTDSLTSIGRIFKGNTNLVTLDISNLTIDTSVVTDYTEIFLESPNIEYIKCNSTDTINLVVSQLPTRASDNQGTIICKSDTTNLDTTTLQSKYWNILDELTLIAKYVFDKSIHNNCIPEFNTEFEGYFMEDEVVEGSNEVTRTIESCGMLPTTMRFGHPWTNSEEEQMHTKRCNSLLEILDMNTSNIRNMAAMFRICNNLAKINCDWILRTDITNTGAMFQNCFKLTSLDVSNWDTSKVTNMGNMFQNCRNLTSLDVSNFNTSNVTNMQSMFSTCYNLTSLDVSNFNTSKVTNMSSMFGYCTNLTTLDVSNFNTSNVTNTTNMFASTPLLTDIGMIYCDTSTIQKIINAIPTNLNKTIWYKEANIDNITYNNNVTLKKYIEENVEIVLNSPLLEGDIIEVVDDKLCHYHKMGMVVLDGSEKWDIYEQADNTTLYALYSSSDDATKHDNPIDTMPRKGLQMNDICDKFKVEPNVINSATTESIWLHSDVAEYSNCVYICINDNRLIQNTVSGFKQWLQDNPTTVVYELAEPYYEDITPLQSSIALRTFNECNIQIITALPIKTKITYRTNITSAVVMEQELDTLDSGVSLSNLIEEEVDE